MSFKKIASACGLFASLMLAPPLHAQDSSAEIAFSDSSVHVRYSRLIPAAANDGNREYGAGFFFTEERDFVATGRYYVEAHRVGFDRFTLFFGPVAYAAMLSTEDTDVFSLAIGGELRYEFMRSIGLDFVGRAAFAPDVLTFGAADRLWDVTGRAELPLTEQMTGFAGYRLFEIDLLEGTNELENSVHIGIRYRF